MKENGCQFELDVFQGSLTGLVVAEIEFESAEESQRFSPPFWFGKEVTEDKHYKNSHLALMRSGGTRRLIWDQPKKVRFAGLQHHFFWTGCSLEITLPDRSGFEVLMKLVPHASQPHIAVIFLTQLTHRGLWELAQQNGAYACLAKKFTLGEYLDKTIQRAVAFVGQMPKEDRYRPIWP